MRDARQPSLDYIDYFQYGFYSRDLALLAATLKKS